MNKKNHLCFKSQLPNHPQIIDSAFFKSPKEFLSCKLDYLPESSPKSF